jgi:multicomponent Na+:H+ antiporter subunit C
MTTSLAIAAGVLFAVGTYLILMRRLTQVILGIGLLGHGANLVILLAAGPPGNPAFIGSTDEATFFDPLPQALILTAIVITFGVTAFLLALAFRSFLLTHDDEVEDDLEDRFIARLGAADDEVVDEATAQRLRRVEEAEERR